MNISKPRSTIINYSFYKNLFVFTVHNLDRTDDTYICVLFLIKYNVSTDS